MTTNESVKIALLGAMSFILTYFCVPFAGTHALKLNASDVPASVLAITISPQFGIMVLGYKIILELIFKSFNLPVRLTAFSISAIYIFVSSSFYKIQKNKNSFTLSLSLALGIISSVVYGALFNYYFLFPIYGTDDQTSFKLICSIIMPFIFLKGTMTSFLTIYLKKLLKNFNYFYSIEEPVRK